MTDRQTVGIFRYMENITFVFVMGSVFNYGKACPKAISKDNMASHFIFSNK